jgi:serine/threonine protein kinase
MATRENAGKDEAGEATSPTGGYKSDAGSQEDDAKGQQDDCGNTSYNRQGTTLSDISTNSGTDGSAKGETTAQKGECPEKPIKAPAELHSAFDASEIKYWSPNRFEPLAKIEDANRNRGVVYLMRDLQQDRLVAVKKMPNAWIRNSHEDFVNTYPTETEVPWQDLGCMRFLDSIGFAHSCSFLGVFRDQDYTGVVTSFAAGGDMFGWCGQLKAEVGREREDIIRPYARQMVRALQQLHDLNIVHRDVSLENMLMAQNEENGEMEVKIIDFGMASTERYFKDSVRGKVSFHAPEVHTDQECDAFLSDAFAVGVSLYAALCKDYPWLSTRPGGCKCFDFFQKYGFRKYIQKRKLRVSNKPVGDVISSSLVDLLSGLLAIDPAKRLTLGEAAWNGSGRRSVWDEPWLRGEDLPAKKKAAAS